MKRKVLNELTRLITELNRDRDYINRNVGKQAIDQWLEVASKALTEARRLVSEEVN